MSVKNVKECRQNEMSVVRKQPHGLSCQTELRAPYCLSDMRNQAARRSEKHEKEVSAAGRTHETGG